MFFYYVHIENEYGVQSKLFGPPAHNYMTWAAKMVVGLDTGVHLNKQSIASIFNKKTLIKRAAHNYISPLLKNKRLSFIKETSNP